MTWTIQRLGHRGDGIAEGPVFAARTLPGEEIDGELEGDRVAAPRILLPSPERAKAPCRHYGGCGGCALQHASNGFVTEWKADLVRSALAAHDLPAPIRDISVSPPRSRRRATFSGRRTKKGALVGFHARASDTIVETPDCQLVLPEIAVRLPVLESLVRFGASRRAELSMLVTWSRSGADLAVRGGLPLDGPLRAQLALFAGTSGLARLSWDGDIIAEAHAPIQSFDGIEMAPPAGAFLQATAEGEAALRRSVHEAVGDADRIVDLFAGCGTFALPLARQAEVHAAEADSDSLRALDRAWRFAEGLRKVTTEVRDLFRRPLLPEDLMRFGAAVIDPPRAGGEAQFKALAQAKIPRIAAVSCNPVTFARDAAVLTRAGYRLEWIDVVDQFRWSPHVELAALFVTANN